MVISSLNEYVPQVFGIRAYDGAPCLLLFHLYQSSIWRNIEMTKPGMMMVVIMMVIMMVMVVKK